MSALRTRCAFGPLQTFKNRRFAKSAPACDDTGGHCVSSPPTDCRKVDETVEHYGEHVWRDGHAVQMIVFDDSSPANQEKYSPLLEQTKTHNDLYYVGPRENEQFPTYLNGATRGRVPSGCTAAVAAHRPTRRTPPRPEGRPLADPWRSAAHERLRDVTAGPTVRPWAQAGS